MVAAVPEDPQHERATRPIAIVAICIGVLAFGGVIAAILLSSHPPDDAPETVQIEVRTQRRVPIRIDGHAVGRAPVMVAVPKGHAPVQIEADLGGRTVSRSVVPDRDQLVDLQLPTR